MEYASLEDFVAQKGQTEAARLLGVTPPAISKALSAARSITVTKLADGTYSAAEQRPFPVSHSKKSAA